MPALKGLALAANDDAMNVGRLERAARGVSEFQDHVVVDRVSLLGAVQDYVPTRSSSATLTYSLMK